MARGIYKRGNVYWIRYTGFDGKKRFESTHSEKHRDAEALLLKRKQAIMEGKEPDVIRIKSHTFSQLAEPYLQWAARQRSIDSKAIFVRQLNQVFGNLPLRRLNTMLIEQWQTVRLNGGNKPATVNRLLATLKHMIRKAVEWHMVEEETLKRVRCVKFLEENNRRLRYLSKEECHDLITACEPHLRPIVITALNTGMRKGEILGLTWDRVDLKNGFIHLNLTKNGERRSLPISDTLRDTLQGLVRRLDVPYVFFDHITGKPFKDVKKSFASALRRAKIMDFRFHDCRHTFASHCVMAGVDLMTVKELLGHKTLTMTLRYSHLAPAHMVKAIDVLDKALKCNNEQSIQKVYNRPFSDEKRATLSA